MVACPQGLLSLENFPLEQPVPLSGPTAAIPHP